MTLHTVKGFAHCQRGPELWEVDIEFQDREPIRLIAKKPPQALLNVVLSTERKSILDLAEMLNGKIVTEFPRFHR